MHPNGPREQTGNNGIKDGALNVIHTRRMDLSTLRMPQL